MRKLFNGLATMLPGIDHYGQRAEALIVGFDGTKSH